MAGWNETVLDSFMGSFGPQPRTGSQQMRALLSGNRPGAPRRQAALPAAPAAPLLGSLSASYFKQPQAGLTQPGVVGVPQAGLPAMGNRARGEASWTQRYGTTPKWSRLQE